MLLLTLGLTLLAPARVWACRCDFTARDAMAKDPLKAATAIVGRVESSGGKSVIKVQRSWTGFRMAFDDVESSTCSLRLESGRTYLILSVEAADTIERRALGFTVCDSIIKEVSAAAELITQLAAADMEKYLAPNPSWSFCRASSDCVGEAAVCGGPVAVNRNYAEAYHSWLRATAPRLNCAGNAKPAQALDFGCEASFCVVTRSGPAAPAAAAPAPPSQSGSGGTGLCGESDPKWTACTDDSQCIAMLNACEALSAYNRAYVGPVARYNKCIQPAIKCSDPGNPNLLKATAACRDGRCQAVQ